MMDLGFAALNNLKKPSFEEKTRFQISVAIRRLLLQDTGAEDYCALFGRLIARLRCMESVIAQEITAHGVCLLLYRG